MGNNGSSSVCTGKSAHGLNQYCYTTGYEHSRPNASPDSVGESLGAAPCTTNTNANQCYANGYRDGMSGVSAGSSCENRSNNTLIGRNHSNKQSYQMSQNPHTYLNNQDEIKVKTIDIHVIKLYKGRDTSFRKTMIFKVHTTDTIASLKKQICTREQIPENEQKIFFGDIELQDECHVIGIYIKDDGGTLFLRCD